MTEPRTRTKYTYDLNGNTLTKVVGSNTTSYAWDYENQLTSVTLPSSGGTVTFKYDPFGRRIEKVTPSTTSIFLYDGDNLIEEANSSGGVVGRYSQTQNIDEPLAMSRSSATDYYEADGLSSITSLTASNGTVAQSYTYDSLGNLTNSSGSLTNYFRYTGREFDTETDLYYYRARYYDPSPGRFLSEDPIHFTAGVNFYRYARNRPTDFRDPLGLCPPSCRTRAVEKNLFAAGIDAIGLIPEGGVVSSGVGNLLGWSGEVATSVGGNLINGIGIESGTLMTVVGVGENSGNSGIGKGIGDAQTLVGVVGVGLGVAHAVLRKVGWLPVGGQVAAVISLGLDAINLGYDLWKCNGGD